MNRATAVILATVVAAIVGLGVAIRAKEARRHRREQLQSASASASPPAPAAPKSLRAARKSMDPEIAAALARDAGVAAPLAAATPGHVPPGCKAPPPASPPPAARGIEVAAIEAYADARTGPKTPAKYDRAAYEAKAREMTADIARGGPVDFWTSCMERFTAVEGANVPKPMVECIDSIDVCHDDRGGYGCCPRACIEEHKRLMRLRCPGGCGAADEMRILSEGIFSGHCVPGYGELVDEGKRDDANAAKQRNRETRAIAPLVSAAGGLLFASFAGGLRYSRDEGANWLPADEGLDDEPLYEIAGDSAGRAIFARAYSGLFAWTGSRWVRIWDGQRGHNGLNVESYDIKQLIVDRTGALWVRSYSQVERTTDRGHSWSHIILPQHDTVELSLLGDGSIVCGGFTKAFRSNDEGAGWTLLPPADYAIKKQHTFWTNHVTSGADGWLYVVTAMSVARSRDGYQWENLGSNPLPNSIGKFAVDRAGTMLFGGHNRQLLRRVAGGEWQPVVIDH